MRSPLVCLALAWRMGGAYAFAQAQEVQQLQDKIQQVERLTQELKERLAAVEEAQPGKAQVVNATVVQPAGAGNAAQPALSDNTSGAAPVKEIGITTGTKTTPPQTETDKEEKEHPRYDLYGFVMLDFGYDFGQNDPNWFDTMRPTKLPSFSNQFGRDGRAYSGVRQTRVGIKA